MDSSRTYLCAKDISKTFPGGLVANKCIDLEIKKNTIHALVGENGAGKTTLMNILMGLYKPDNGRIFIEGKETKILSPKDAVRNGLMMVPQFSSLIGPYDGRRNLAITNQFCKGYMPKLKSSFRALTEIADKLGFTLDLCCPAEYLAYEDRQRIEILRALCCNIALLILDEPTSMLTPQDADSIYKALRKAVSERDLAVLYSTHKLQEVINYADEVTVLRGGGVILSKPVKQTTEDELVRAVTGEEVPGPLRRENTSSSKAALSVRNVSCLNEKKKWVLNDVSMTVMSGEIVGLAGSSKSGKFELMEAIAGLRRIGKGVIEVDQTDVSKYNHKKIINMGLCYCPPAANVVSLVPDFTVAENLILTTYDKEPFSERLVLDTRSIKDNAYHCVKDFDVKTPSIDSFARVLSGGNKQKLALAREFSRKNKRAMMLADPTIGLDVKTAYRIWEKILDLKSQGIGILLVSEDLNEIKQLSDKIVVLYEGKVVDTFPSSKYSVYDIGLMMLSGKAKTEEKQWN